MGRFEKRMIVILSAILLLTIPKWFDSYALVEWYIYDISAALRIYFLMVSLMMFVKELYLVRMLRMFIFVSIVDVFALFADYLYSDELDFWFLILKVTLYVCALFIFAIDFDKYVKGWDYKII